MKFDHTEIRDGTFLLKQTSAVSDISESRRTLRVNSGVTNEFDLKHRCCILLLYQFRPIPLMCFSDFGTIFILKRKGCHP